MKRQIVAIIQARTGSTRLPGKVLKDIDGETMLSRVVRRVRRANLLNDVVVATTVEPSDDAILAECRRLDVSVFRGDTQDVLGRYYEAAETHQAQFVVRITSDCPLIDPGVIDHVIHAFLSELPDYASNTLIRTYPRGLDTEVMTTSVLGKAYDEAVKPYQRVHVTPYIYENPCLFKLLSVKAETNHSQHRWTVDTQEDLDFVRAIYARLGNSEIFSWRDVLALLAHDPELAELNLRVIHKTLEQG